MMEYFLYGSGFEGTFGKYSLSISKGYSCSYFTVITNRPHLHSFSELCFVSSGSGQYIHGDFQAEISVGDMVISDPEITHEISSKITRDLELVFFRIEIKENASFPGHATEERILGKFVKKHKHVCRDCDHLLRYIPLLVSAKEGISREFGSRSAIRNMVLEGLELLSFNTEADTPHPVITRALDYIDRNISKRLSAAGIAGELGISDRQLRRIFRTELDRTVVEVLHQRMMTHARELLSLNWRVNEVAYTLNFDDPAQFSRLFKKCCKLSPRKYKQEYSEEFL